MNKFLRVLTVQACMLVLLGTSALADTAVGTLEQLRSAFAVNNPGTITLTKNIAFSAEKIEVNGNAVLDLNGHVITVDSSDALFEVGSGDTLTIQDSSQYTISSDQVDTMGKLTGKATPSRYGRDASYTDGRLTWYETVSSIVYENGVGVGTTEKVYRKRSSNMGRIIAGTNATRAINVNGGRLQISSGAIYGFTNSAILVSGGGYMNMSGGYLLGNSANNGGALYVTGSGSNFNIGGTAVMSGNNAWWNGGAIYMENSGIGGMNGGMLTNNQSHGSAYDDGGGAVMVATRRTIDASSEDGMSAVFVMSGGQITGNIAQSSGGGVRTRVEWWISGEDVQTNNNDVSFTMSGGIIASNVAIAAEGGGVSINGTGHGYITGNPNYGEKSYITNNASNTDQDWGGGGLFCADYSWIYMDAALIIDNTAGGFGGGIAGCSTGRIDTVSLNVEEHGAAIYDNEARGKNLSGDASSKHEDHLYTSGVFQEGGYDDYFCALSSHISGTMLGGGSAEWTGSVDGALIKDPVGKGEVVDAISIAGLISHPNGADQDTAEAKAYVVISGNYANTHGGGILVNGYLLVDQWGNRTIRVGDRLTLLGKKSVYDKNDNLTSQKAKAFTFNVYEANSSWKITNQTPVIIGKNNAASAGNTSDIDFEERLIFNQDGTYYYVINETASGLASMQTDDAEYRLRVKVELDRASSSHGPIIVDFYRITHVNLTRVKNGESTTIYNANPNSIDSEAVQISGFDFANREVELKKETEVIVIKKWSGAEDLPAYVTVALWADRGTSSEQKAGEVNLTAQTGWKHTWTGLEADRTYTIEEKTPSGFTSVQDAPVMSTRDEDGKQITTIAITITNTKNAVRKAELAVDKKWVGGNERPEITVNLRTGGAAVASAKLNQSNGWKHTFTDLDPDKKYTVEEEKVPDYAASYSEPVISTRTDGNSVTTTTTTITITNTRVEEKKQNVVVTKRWLGGDTYPSSITVNLYDGSALVDTAQLSEAGNWTHTWTNLPHSSGYRVEELSVTGYTGTCESHVRTIDGVVTKTFVLTNVKDTVMETLKDMPQTGDRSMLGFWMAALAVSGVAARVLWRRRKES